MLALRVMLENLAERELQVKRDLKALTVIQVNAVNQENMENLEKTAVLVKQVILEAMVKMAYPDQRGHGVKTELTEK